MPAELPYLASYKNVGAVFEKIRSAKVPEAFTTAYLADTLGFKSSTDRALITLLKTLGFLDAAGRPSTNYSLLKHDKSGKPAIAAAIKKAYEPLFTANEKANELSNDELKGLIGQVAGSDESMTNRILYTFKALCGAAYWSAQSTPITTDKDEETEQEKPESNKDEPDTTASRRSLRPDFHYNIQVHLPANGSEETYINIFNAIRKTFK